MLFSKAVSPLEATPFGTPRLRKSPKTRKSRKTIPKRNVAVKSHFDSLSEINEKFDLSKVEVVCVWIKNVVVSL